MELALSSIAVIWAGLISFLSPCVLPLVPPYLCFISGMSLEQMSGNGASSPANRQPVMLASLAFVFGFSTVFIFMGAAASSIGQLLRANLPLLSQIAGVFIIVMGLNFLGLFKIGFLSREARYHQETRPAGLLGAYAVGLAFAFGWTPCIGPVLAAVFCVAQGMKLLALYSLGLGIPFLLAAYSMDAFLRFFAGFRKHMGTVEKVMGAALVLTGIMFLAGGMQWMSSLLLEYFPGLASLG
jgi:cytochrome c-type biogenesis protein